MTLKNFIYLFLTFFILSSCASTKIKNSKDLNPSGFQLVIDSIYQSNPKSIGIMVHIEAPKKGISWSGSVGYADFENKITVTPDQPALIASNLKTYISAAILRLQEQNLLNIEDAIKRHLSDQTVKLFESDGYDMESIKIKHLLSHTSGIQDYANKEYLDWIDKNQKYRWTRNEQLELAIEVGDPLGQPEDVFSYADANFLLCTEIIESITGQHFHSSIRELLRYKELEFSNTWFPTLDKKNPQTKPLVHQYWSEKNWDSYNHDISWDLYGGGGIATTTKELAQFSYQLFNGNIIKDPEILNLIFTRLPTKDGQDLKYCLGLNESEIHSYQAFGHGGFWGTIVMYLPELDASISAYVLDRSERQILENILNALVERLKVKR